MTHSRVLQDERPAVKGHTQYKLVARGSLFNQILDCVILFNNEKLEKR